MLVVIVSRSLAAKTSKIDLRCSRKQSIFYRNKLIGFRSNQWPHLDVALLALTAPIVRKSLVKHGRGSALISIGFNIPRQTSTNKGPSVYLPPIVISWSNTHLSYVQILFYKQIFQSNVWLYTNIYDSIFANELKERCMMHIYVDDRNKTVNLLRLIRKYLKKKEKIEINLNS